MKRLLPYIFSVLSLGAAAQTDSLVVNTLPADTTSTDTDVVYDTVKLRFFNPSLQVDYGKLISTLAGIDVKYEGGLSLLFFEHVLLSAEYGYGKLSPDNAFKNGKYLSEGRYFRAGGGYSDQLGPKSLLGFGVYFGSSKFEHRGEVYIQSNSGVQEDFSKTFSRSNLEARWFELFLTSESLLQFNKTNPEARINQLFALGFNLRLRIMSSYDEDEPFDVYSIPGYGLNLRNTSPALNLFIKFYPF